MKYSVVYSSKTGNTKALAEHIKNILPSEECEYFGEADKKALDADMIFAGFWTDKGSCDEGSVNFCDLQTERSYFYSAQQDSEDLRTILTRYFQQ